MEVSNATIEVWQEYMARMEVLHQEMSAYAKLSEESFLLKRVMASMKAAIEIAKNPALVERYSKPDQYGKQAK